MLRTSLIYDLNSGKLKEVNADDSSMEFCVVLQHKIRICTIRIEYNVVLNYKCTVKRPHGTITRSVLLSRLIPVHTIKGPPPNF